jgi:Ca-activated chloride channel family protein
MRSRREDVTAAAAAFATMRHPLDEFFTLRFNESIWPGLPPTVAFTGDADQLRAALSVTPPPGMTALYDAVERGLAHLQLGTHGRRALIVVSDGGDNASAQTFPAVLEQARRTNAVLYSVTLFDPDNRDAKPEVLKTLARETGGHAFAPKRPEEVMTSFSRIALEIRSGYTIGFVPSETADGGFRIIRVVVNVSGHRQLVARTRAGYYAGPSETLDR